MEKIESGFTTEVRFHTTVVGIGNAGCKAVDRFNELGINGVNCVLMNSDAVALGLSHSCGNRILIGDGLGAGNDAAKGRMAAEEDAGKIRSVLDDSGSQFLIIVAGLGSGTGSGASPVVARIARELYMTVLGIVTLPFAFEMSAKRRVALSAVEELDQVCHSLMTIENESLTRQEGFNISSAFAISDDAIAEAAADVVSMIENGYILIGYNNFLLSIRSAKRTFIRHVEAEGDDSIQKAFLAIVGDMGKAADCKTLLVKYESSEENCPTVAELNQINSLVNDRFGKTEGDITYLHGFGYDDTLGNKIRLTLMTTYDE